MIDPHPELARLRSSTVAAEGPRLGMSIAHRRWGPCPACGAERASGSDRRPPIHVYGASGQMWTCNACHATGDVVDLVCYARVGCAAKDAGARFRDVLGDAPLVQPIAPSAPATPLLEPDEVRGLFRRATHVQRAGDREVATWCRSRGLDHARLDAYVLPDRSGVPWWPYPRDWRLAVPMFDRHGQPRSVHGRSVTGATPKTRFPARHSATELLFACPLALELLRGTRPSVTLLIVCEGVTDYWTLRQRAPAGVGVVGVTSGSAPALAALAKIDAPIAIATHDDEAGNRYARRIAEALAPRTTTRMTPT